MIARFLLRLGPFLFLLLAARRRFANAFEPLLLRRFGQGWLLLLLLFPLRWQRTVRRQAGPERPP